MIVVDEYLAIRSVLGDTPNSLLDDVLAITTSVHCRILHRLHLPGTGQLLIAEMLAASVRHGRTLWYGSERNIG